MRKISPIMAVLAAATVLLAAGGAYWGWRMLWPPEEPFVANAPLPPRVLGFRLNVRTTGENAYSFARAELDAALKDPYQLTHLGRIGAAPDGSGVAVLAAPAGSLIQRLGLQAGDVILSLNGQPVATPRDLGRICATACQLPRMVGQVRRGTKVLDFSYAAQG
ncbi:hypothetical protein BWI17_12475 [Betaproteobacteria bacterium GR16-43]|nr:hypothetical protein BWI17_12475 [Betaproteobacteria bacterium GR16-43]